ncbi:Cadherin-5 [Merluccius polli]|uniref:Cadherin-5 n=1 Tax=Merluccius polli TaxID=89951 RepID=A0AA47NUY2_MERPO|nr:Cadherin-5 [Merluccius polli]
MAQQHNKNKQRRVSNMGSALTEGPSGTKAFNLSDHPPPPPPPPPMLAQRTRTLKWVITKETGSPACPPYTTTSSGLWIRLQSPSKTMTGIAMWRAAPATLAMLFLVVALAEQQGVPSDPSSAAEGRRGGGGGLEIVRKEKHLSRHKRDWLWNVHYVLEEVEPPQKFGKLKSSKTTDGVIYKLEGDGANTIFTVNKDGELSLTKTLDREEKSEYNLTALMYNSMNELVEKGGDFTVHVSDVNDNPPVFPVAYNGSILERSNEGTRVVQVTATDRDGPLYGAQRYSLRPEGDHSAFQIDRITGMITSKMGTLDREVQNKYVLVVQAKDSQGMTAGLTATTTVTITITDINDNQASFSKRTYDLRVLENQRLEDAIGTLTLIDNDEIQNKDPTFTITPSSNSMFDVSRSRQKDCNINLKQVNIEVVDVDEPPVFSQPMYAFSVMEETMVTNIGTIIAKDPDHAKKTIQYFAEDHDCPIGVNPITGQLFSLRKLDRELKSTHIFRFRAQEESNGNSPGMHSFVKVNISVQDMNDNAPELAWDDIFVCENDMAGTVIGRLSATDKDEQVAHFHYSLANPSDNFTITKNASDNTAVIRLKSGGFRLDDPIDYNLGVRVEDGGQPPKSSVMNVPIKVCRCDSRRIHTRCKAAALRMGVSIHALIAVLLCILTILVIVILVVIRRRFHKESLANMRHSGEIHEQLVTYDEEGGGEMDTNGYDVSILTSARHDGSLLMHPDHGLHPSLYARVQKQPAQQRHQLLHPNHLLSAPLPPAACKGDMAVMIEKKKDAADHDRDGVPFDTLHIYGYEGGSGSLAGSLSSLDSSRSSTGSGGPEYDFLNDWGPRFRTLAELYGVDEADGYLPY